ncbi:hypothetical protein HWI79_1733 [Cryptosporidium felis]|nr:hypothetical protein HWI79_1733 [Cryptosporidium felis]
MNDLEDSTYRFYTSPEDQLELENYRSNLLRFNHDEFLLQSTARQSGYVVNSYIHGRAASEYSCSSRSFPDLNTSAEETCFERSLSPINRTMETTTSEISTIPSARSAIERTRRGRSPSLSYTVTTLQSQSNVQNNFKTSSNGQTNWSSQLISFNDRNPMGALTMKSIDLNPPQLSENSYHPFQLNRVLNQEFETNSRRTTKTSRTSLCTYFDFCNCFGPRVKDLHNFK